MSIELATIEGISFPDLHVTQFVGNYSICLQFTQIVAGPDIRTIRIDAEQELALLKLLQERQNEKNSIPS